MLGPGPKGAGRKLGRRDIITVKCQMPEDGMTPGDVENFRDHHAEFEVAARGRDGC